MSVEVIEAPPGHLRVKGPITFETARAAHTAGLRLIQAGAGDLQVDCSGVTDSDSAGLVVLLDWLARARQRGRALRFAHVPHRVAAVAQISEIEQLLGIPPAA